jgi:transcriptional regulator NrdR family protein
MVCIYCSEPTQVVNSRHQKRSNQVWRRRKCLQCHSIWTTTEATDYSQALAIQRKSGKLEPFVREQLFISVYESCKHRPSALDDAQALTATIIGKLLKHVHNASIPREIIITTTIGVLKHFDNVAGVHYDAYHKV